MVGMAIRVVINAVGLWVAAKYVPHISFPSADRFPNGDVLPFIVVALIFGVVNAYLKPIVKALSFPISLMTIGLVGFVINAAMLLLTAFLADLVQKKAFVIGGFPPTITIDTLVAAILGAIVISVVSTALTLATAPIRR